MHLLFETVAFADFSVRAAQRAELSEEVELSHRDDGSARTSAVCILNALALCKVTRVRVPALSLLCRRRCGIEGPAGSARVSAKITSDLRCNSLSTALAGQDWALLIAGSAGWGNYRHQADVCHVRALEQLWLRRRCWGALTMKAVPF